MLPKAILNRGRSVALLLAACCLLAGAAAAQTQNGGPVPSVNEAVRSLAGRLTIPPEARPPLQVGRPTRDSPLSGYAAHMLAFYLHQRGLAAAIRPYEGGRQADGLPDCLLTSLRAEGTAVFLQARTGQTGAGRALSVTVWDAETGQRLSRIDTPFHLPADLQALVEGQRSPMEPADRRWLELFDGMFPERNPADGRSTPLAAADFFFQEGIWLPAAERYLVGEAPAPDTAFVRGVFALQMAGHWEEAESAVRDALNTHFDSGPLYALWSWLVQRQGRPQDAIMFLDQARLMDLPHEGLYLFARALLAMEQDDASSAEQNLRRAADMLPDMLAPQVEAARFYWSRGELPQAIAYFRRATQFDDCPPEVRAELAMLLEATDDAEGALNELKRAFRLGQDSAVVTRQLASLLRRKGQHDRALDVLRRAAEANPCSGALLSAYGDGAAAMWDIETAQEQFQKAARLGIGFPYARVRLADILALRREYGRAQSELTALLAENPDYAPARISMGRILAELEQVEEAISTLKEVTSDAKHEVAARLALAEVYVAAGRPEQAVRETQIAVSARADAETYGALCRAFMAAEQVDKAASAAKSALSEAPNAPKAHLAMARVHLARGVLEQAIEETTAALDRDPYMFEALRLRGRIRRQMGQLRACAAAWQRALGLNPWAADLHFELSRLLGEQLGDQEDSLRHYARWLELEQRRKQQSP
ncbi:MAG: tetratricopeptide repeat protein [Candidatus Brocadiia bacterium]